MQMGKPFQRVWSHDIKYRFIQHRTCRSAYLIALPTKYLTPSFLFVRSCATWAPNSHPHGLDDRGKTWRSREACPHWRPLENAPEDPGGISCLQASCSEVYDNKHSKKSSLRRVLNCQSRWMSLKVIHVLCRTPRTAPRAAPVSGFMIIVNDIDNTGTCTKVDVCYV